MVLTQRVYLESTIVIFNHNIADNMQTIIYPHTILTVYLYKKPRTLVHFTPLFIFKGLKMCCVIHLKKSKNIHKTSVREY